MTGILKNVSKSMIDNCSYGLDVILLVALTSKSAICRAAGRFFGSTS